MMVEAGKLVLRGFVLRCDAVVFKYPDRYDEPRGRAMWDTIRAVASKIHTESDVKCETEVSSG